VQTLLLFTQISKELFVVVRERVPDPRCNPGDLIVLATEFDTGRQQPFGEQL
jgi:hypothetical protein